MAWGAVGFRPGGKNSGGVGVHGGFQGKQGEAVGVEGGCRSRSEGEDKEGNEKMVHWHC